MVTTFTTYRLISTNLDRSLESVAQTPEYARASERYLQDIGSIKSIDELLSNERVFNYAMDAHGLSDMTYAKAFMRKVLEEGIDDESAFANQLTDPRYKAFAETFNFKRHGDLTTVFEKTRTGTVEKYTRQMLEVEQGAQNEGVRLALYFRRSAADIDNVFDLLGDPALLRVTQVIADLPVASGALPIERQAELVTNRIDLDSLKDPEKLDRLLERFAAKWDASDSAPATLSPAVQILQNTGFSGPDLNTLLLLQNN